MAALARAAEAPGALARGPDGEPAARRPRRARTSAAPAPPSTPQGRLLGAGAGDRRRLRRLLLLSRQLPGPRGGDDPDRPVQGAGLRYDVKVRADQQGRQRADARADGDHQLGDGRHDGRDRARARARPGRRCGASTCCEPDDLPYTMATGEVLARHHAARNASKRRWRRSTTRGFRERQAAARAAGPSTSAWASARWSSPPPTARAFYKSAGIPGSGPRGGLGAHRAVRRRQCVGRARGRPARATKPRCRRRSPRAWASTRRACTSSSATPTSRPTAWAAAARAAARPAAARSTCARSMRGPRCWRSPRSCWAWPRSPSLRMRRRPHRARGRRAWSDAGLTLADVARTAYLDPTGAAARAWRRGWISAARYDPPPMTYSNATHACEVERRRRAPARITIERYLVAEDCGTVLSPVVVEGQQHGAIAMGLVGALFEHVVYDQQRTEPDRHAAGLSGGDGRRAARLRDHCPCTRPTARRRPASRAWPKAA